MQRMHELADEVRETFEERGYRIEQAVQLDGAFRRTRRPQSSLGRALFLSAVEEAAGRIGLGYRSVSGGAVDVVDVVDVADRRFRIRKAEVDPDSGDYKIIAGSDSILTVTDADSESLLRPERWVLGYTVDDDGLIVDIFAALVYGISNDSVPLLELGPVAMLGSNFSSTPPSGGGFQPPDEDDLGDDLDYGTSGEGGESNVG